MPKLIRFDRTRTCDRQTDRQTDIDSNRHRAIAGICAGTASRGWKRIGLEKVYRIYSMMHRRNYVPFPSPFVLHQCFTHSLPYSFVPSPLKFNKEVWERFPQCPAKKWQPAAKLGWDQIHSINFKVRGDASHGSHRVAAPTAWWCFLYWLRVMTQHP